MKVAVGRDAPPSPPPPPRRHSMRGARTSPRSSRGGARKTTGRRSLYLAMALVLAAANTLTLRDVRLPWVSSTLGFLAVAGIPAALLYLANVGGTQTRGERLATSVVLALALLVVSGLVINTVLPYLGVPRPLATVPVVALVDLLCVGLGVWAFPRYSWPWPLARPVLTRRDLLMTSLGLAAVVLAVVGAVRLNNGASGAVTLFTLVMIVGVFSLLLLWRDRLHPGVTPVTIYCVALSLLFMTSLRGWYTTGHDVQREFYVFELAKAHGIWNVALFRDAYNACLSITILPTMIARWTRVADPFVFKVFFQILFALCPVLVYRLATRVSSAAVGLVATIFFVSFVTFFQDMPMLNRQEVAFLFLLCGLLALFNTQMPIRRRQVWFGVFAVGMILSHYSTTYVTIGVLAFTWAIRVGAGLVRKVLARLTPRFASRVTPAIVQRGGYAIGPALIGLLALGAFAWSAPATHTERGLTQTVRDAIANLRGGSGAEHSSDTSYSIFSVGSTPPSVKLAAYHQQTLRDSEAGRAAGVYYDAETLARYATPVVPSQNVPITSFGQEFRELGLNLAWFNRTVRAASATILQLLIALGLLVVLLARRRSGGPPPEFYFLALGNLAVVVLQVILPVLTVDYGLLRAFQQALIILDVFVVAGSLALVPGGLGERWRVLAAGAVALGFFASSTGIIPQALGDYGPQLHLNNAGTYYDNYYLHPEELAALAWIQHHARGTAAHPHVVVQTDRFTANKLSTYSGMSLLGNLYPDLVQKNAYVLLNYTVVHRGTSTVSYAGDLLTYRYPVGFLDDNKDLIYSSGGARVYR